MCVIKKKIATQIITFYHDINLHLYTGPLNFDYFKKPHKEKLVYLLFALNPTSVLVKKTADLQPIMLNIRRQAQQQL